MTQDAATAPPPVPARAWRNVAVLVLAQALLGAQMSMIFIVGGLAGKMLAPHPGLATAPISLIVLGSALSAQPMARFMQARGRRAGFILATLAGALGAAGAAWGLYSGHFGIFLAGSALTGIYMAAQGFYRFAATDTAPEAFQPKAISYVMAGGLAAALIGPELVRQTANLTAVPFLATYAAVIGLNALGPLLFSFLDIPRPERPGPDHDHGRPMREILREPVIIVAMICAMVSYALMNLVMTATPLAVVGCGFEVGDAAGVVRAHVLAMFVPSFFTGWVIARLGTRLVVGIGLVILAGAGMVAMTGVALDQFYLALVLLGVGWNFGFIGATAMLAGAHRPEERGRVQGLNDFVVFGGVFLASLSSGLLMNCGFGPEGFTCTGRDVIEGWQAVNLAMVPFLMLAGAALIWLVLRPRDIR